MSDTILPTKLFVPSPLPDLVPRGRLFDILDQTGAAPLILISAPAGFGKTTLVSTWLRRNSQEAGWVSLDADDNNPERFFRHLFTAIEFSSSENLDESLKLLGKGAITNNPDFLRGTVTELSTLVKPLTVVLDDFHLIENSAIHEWLLFLLEHSPPKLQIMILSRSDPPWPLGRLRAHRKMTEIRAAELRFDLQETSAFLNQLVGLNLTENQINLLDQRIEGWAAGLQMAAISMRGRQDIDGFIQSFTGSHRYIFDFLIEEVLDQQDEATLQFLLKTSILDRLSAPLAAAVTGISDAQEVLTGLERSNLFIIQLDDDRSWYRYHHLFSDLLQQRLLRSPELDSTALHLAASGWYEANNLISEAIRHAVIAGGTEKLVELIERNSLRLAYQGQISELREWLGKLGDSEIRNRPWLCLANAWVEGFAGQISEVSTWVERVQQAAEQAKDLPRKEQDWIAGHVSLLQAYSAAFVENPADLIHFAQEAARQIPDEDKIACCLSAVFIAIAHRMMRDYEQSAAQFNLALEQIKHAGEIHLMVDALWERSVLESIRGQTQRALETCQVARQHAEDYWRKNGRKLLTLAYIYERLSSMYLERNQIEKAHSLALEAFQLARRWGNADAEVECNLIYVNTLAAKGQVDEALHLLDHTAEIAQTMGPWYKATTCSTRALVQLTSGNHAAAAETLKEFEAKNASSDSKKYPSILLAQGMTNLVQGNSDHTFKLLDQIEETGELNFKRQVKVDALRAVALFETGQRGPALKLAREVVARTEHHGYIRLFLNFGKPMLNLLQETARTFPSNRISNLLQAFPESKFEGAPAPVNELVLLEPLTTREETILKLLATDLTIPEIADELFIAVSTVRTHIKNIYSKLGVHSRFEAISKAKQFGENYH